MRCVCCWGVVWRVMLGARRDCEAMWGLTKHGRVCCCGQASTIPYQAVSDAACASDSNVVESQRKRFKHLTTGTCMHRSR